MIQDDQPTIDSIYRCLASARRRYILRYLQRADDETASLDDLVDYVVEQETHSSAPDRESILIDLYHVQVPILADNGMVDFDERTQMVRNRMHPKFEPVIQVG